MSTSTAVDPAILNAVNAAPATCPYCGATVTAAGADHGHEREAAELVRRLGFLVRKCPARACVLFIRTLDRSASLESIGAEVSRILNRERSLTRQCVQQHAERLLADFPELACLLTPRLNGGR